MADARELTLAQVRDNNFSFSPSQYTELVITSPTTRTVRQLLDPNRPYDAGAEPGSDAYVNSSAYHMIRTKALQRHSWLVYPKGDAIVPVNPRLFNPAPLAEDDILLSKDSNVGEVALVDAERAIDHMRSGAVLRLNPTIEPLYLFAFLKHPSFTSQVGAATPRGATIRHAGERWLDCWIPLPNQPNSEAVISYVADLARVIADKERLIRERSRAIQLAISDELDSGMSRPLPAHTMPTLAEIRSRGRFDAAIYDREYKDTVGLVESYKHGSESPSEAGFDVRPGPSLELKIIKTRVDADEPRPGFYALLLPKNLSEYGTINRLQYLGTPKQLPILRKGDVLFGEAGFHKGRSVVLIDAPERCTTNAHGIYARHQDRDVDAAIVFRCVFDWYRERGLVDLMAVGGSGGHLSPSYFDEYVRLPRFPSEVRKRIANLYSSTRGSEEPVPAMPGRLLADHAVRNVSLGTWQLNVDRAALLEVLHAVQAQIISGEAVDLPGF